MGHHAPVRREVIPADELPLPVPEIPSFASSTPALVARAPNPDSTSTCNDGDNCEKSTSEMTTTVLPVVLGAWYVILEIPILHKGTLRLILN